mgnify:CR=1 FL=1
MNAQIKAPDVRDALHALAERLPEGASWADVEEYVRFRAAVAEGKEGIARGEIASEAEVRRVFAKYGVQV